MKQTKPTAPNGGYGIMPNEVLFDIELSPTAKLTYCLVSSLCAKTGECFASNAYIARRMGYSKSHATKVLAELRGWIGFQFDVGGRRTLYLCPLGVPPSKTTRGVVEIDEGGSQKQRGDLNSTSLISQTKENIVEPAEVRRVYELFIDRFGKNPNQYRLSEKRVQKIRQRLKDAGVDMLTRAIDNTASSAFHRGDNDRGWQADLDFIVNSYERVEKMANLGNKEVTYQADW